MANKILIVEDDFVSGKLLGKIIINLGYELIDIIPSAEGALNSIVMKKPDLVLMDINLSGIMDGIHTAELLNGYYNIPVVFVTQHSDEGTIIKAKKNGIGYIVKPVFEKEIKEVLDIVFSNIKNKHLSNAPNNNIFKLAIKDEEKILFIDLYDISYIESQGHISLIYINNFVFKKRSSIKEIEDMDVKNKFFRCHKSFLVNLDMVEGLICEENYKYQIKLKSTKMLIPISKNKLKEFRNIIKIF